MFGLSGGVQVTTRKSHPDASTLYVLVDLSVVLAMLVHFSQAPAYAIPIVSVMPTIISSEACKYLFNSQIS